MPGNIHVLKKILEDTEKEDPVATRIAVFNLVRDIPYAIIPDLTKPEKCTEIIRLNGGFCYPKHFLLAVIFDLLDIPVLYEVCRFDWKEFYHIFPKNLRELAEKIPPATHLSLRAEIEGNFVLVDATFDLPLEKLGFKINRDWDGLGSTSLPITPLENPEIHSYQETYLLQMKGADRDSLLFYGKLNAWLNESRQKIENSP